MLYRSSHSAGIAGGSAAETAGGGKAGQEDGKMAAIARLAGGVAHDFNNLLAVVQGYSEVLLRRMAPDDPLRQFAEEIRRAAERGAGLTGELLMFSGRVVTQPQTLDVNRVLEGMMPRLQTAVQAPVHLIVEPAASLRPISADIGQIQQVILNLVLNARDAVASGGQITVRTAQRESGDEGTSGVELSVHDTGPAMDETTRSRSFEPFFNPRTERRAGLNLAIVYAIVRQCGGNIAVRSGEGNTFEVTFPAAG